MNVKIWFLCLLVILSSFCICFADDYTSSSAITSGAIDLQAIIDSLPNNDTLVVVDNSSIGSAISDLKTVSEPLQLRSVNVSNETITAANSNGFKAVVLGLIGDYTSIVTDYTYSNTQGYTSHSIEVTPDWSWIGSAVIFIVVVFCAFRIVGGLLCNR